MFSNLRLYRLPTGMPLTLSQLEQALATASFVECGKSQAMSVGFVPPREVHSALVESVGGQWIAKLMIETRSVPGDAVARQVKEEAASIEEITGRKPGKKEMREIKENAHLMLLPQAFSKMAAVPIWFNVAAGYVVLDTGSQARADTTITALIKVIDGLALQLFNTVMSPSTAMTQWLATHEAPPGFSVDRECELKAADESKAVVRYTRHSLDTDEISQHIALGKAATRVALTWNDRVSFVLTDGLLLKKLTFLDVVFEKPEGAEGTDHQDNFDADVAIATGELSKMIPDLMEALGGLVEVADTTNSTQAAPLGDEPDPLHAKAVELVRKHRKASISLVQRHLQIGYNRAARLLEQMETEGIVSAMSSGGARTLL